jgi:glycosyltransferase involved in cell wall biosynthesis
MKIVYIASSPVPSNAANSVHVVKMCQAMGALGHRVTLLAPAAGKGFPAVDIFDHYGVRRNFRHRPLPNFGQGRLAQMLRNMVLTALLRVHRPDIVYSRNLNGAWIAANAGFRVIFERHDVFAETAASKIRRFKELARHPNHLKTVVISSALRDEMVTRYGIDDTQLELAPDGADEIGETEAVEPRGHAFRAGYTGHLYAGRGIEIIGAAAERLPEVEFVIVGGNPDDVGHWKERFAGISNLRLVGHVAPKRVPAFLRSFDVLLAPYQRKVAVAGGGGDTSQWMSPLKIFEYMAAGRAIICSDLPVLREVLEPEKDSIMVPPDDAGSWAEAIARLAGDGDLRRRLEENALAKFTARYSWIRRVETILEGLGDGRLR